MDGIQKFVAGNDEDFFFRKWAFVDSTWPFLIQKALRFGLCEWVWAVWGISVRDRGCCSCMFMYVHVFMVESHILSSKKALVQIWPPKCTEVHRFSKRSYKKNRQEKPGFCAFSFCTGVM